MSIETDFRALLAAHAPLVALVGNRIALNAVPEGAAAPLVVFSAAHDITTSLDGTVGDDACTLSVQCWADTAAGADAVADAVVAALASAPRENCVALTARSGTYEPELGMDATLLTVEWWAA